MTLALTFLSALTAIELLTWMPLLRAWRKGLAAAQVPPLAVATGLLVGNHVAAWTIVIGILGVYRLVNLLRVVQGRPSSTGYLMTSASRSSIVLIGLQLLTLGVAALNHLQPLADNVWVLALLAAQIACSATLLASTQRHLHTTSPPEISQKFAERDLPTLTVGIPARNETDDLEACLQSLIASTYPKLEILVLDDCSQERRTPEIIRAFAHDGVRFLSGKVPPKRWLAKNYAYKQLTEEANGELLLFCGVDVRFQPTTLTHLVQTVIQKKKRMISLAPSNKLPTDNPFGALLLQPNRYAWELALPRRLVRRPPVLSTCWMIYRDLLQQSGGFDAVSHSISPESYFARQAAGHEDGYSFLRNCDLIGMTCVKSTLEQRATAVRTRYPQLHRRPELAGLVSLVEVVCLVLPFALFVVFAVTGHWALVGGYAFDCALLLLFFGKIVNFTYRRTSLLRALLLPFAAAYDVVLLNFSMWQYEFNEVVWKDRNVCIPVMHVVPSLPKH